jgi:coproporphyrinogen III oxidase-like Fe-S oxidoreductase
MFLGLRESRGIDPAAFARRFGRDLEDVHPEVATFRADGFLEDRDGRVTLSERGLLVADSIFAAFL